MGEEAFPTGIFIYLVYCYTRYVKSFENKHSKFSNLVGSWASLKEYWHKKGVAVAFGFIAYAGLFSWRIFTKSTISGLELFAISWGPISALSAYSRVKNGGKND